MQLFVYLCLGVQLQHLSHHKLVKSNNTFFTHAFITPGGWTACLCPLINHAMTQQVKKTLKYVCKSIPSPSLERLHSLNIVRISHALHSCVMPVDRCITLGWAHIYHYMFSLSCNWMRSCCSSLYYHAFV